MKNSTKKWLTVAGCLAICAVLVFVIAGRFSKEPVTDDPLPISSSQPDDVMVTEPDGGDTEQKDDVEVKPEIPSASSTPSVSGNNGAVSSGTDQTIQGDPVKPEPSQEELEDPTQKPDGTPVEGTPTPENHNNVTPPPPPPSTNTGGGLPGFDNVPDGGANQVIEADDMYENGNKIGIMD